MLVHLKSRKFFESPVETGLVNGLIVSAKKRFNHVARKPVITK
jgi:hypothetical protein